MVIRHSLTPFLKIIRTSKIGFLIMAMCLPGCFKKKEHILQIANQAEPASLDPQMATSLPEGTIITALFEGLLIPDPQYLKPLPGMAQSYTISPDGLTYTFTLRDQIFWSNGDPVVAHNFVDAIERGLSKSIASPWTEFYCLLKNAQKYYDTQNTHNGEAIPFSSVGAEAISPRALKLTLEHPVSFFPSLLTHHAWAPLNRKVIEQYGGFFDRDNHWTRPQTIVSNGAYSLESIQIGDKVVLNKNPKYWDAAAVRIPTIHVFSAVDINTQERMFDTGQLHVTSTVSGEKIEFYKKQGSLQQASNLQSHFLWFNCHQKPLDDVRVRKALSLAINRHKIGLLRKRGPGFEAYSIVPHGTMDYPHRDLFQEDVQQAKKLLAEAGYPEGKGFPTLTITCSGMNNSPSATCEALQEMWRETLNIKIDMQNVEWRTFLSKRRLTQFEILCSQWVGDFNDAITFLNLFLSTSNNNFGKWKNEEYDHLLDQAAQTTTTTERIGLLMKAEALMIDDMPATPLYYGSSINLVSPKIGGWYPNILEWHPLKDMYFIK